MNLFGDTTAELSRHAEQHDGILVFYSGGKDSLAVADLCSRFFKRMVFVFMYFIPGLDVTESMLEYGRKRWGVQILQVPHWLLARVLKQGVYCPNYFTEDDLPEIKLGDIYATIRRRTGINLIATGAKDADSLWRRRNLSVSRYGEIVYPLKSRNKFDMLSYLKMRGIPIPDTQAGTATGIDLSTPSLLWLHDKHPEDFKRLCRFFPYAEAVVYRRDFYGVK